MEPLDPKLMSILAKSRNVLTKVETGDFKTGNINGDMLVQESTGDLPSGAAPMMSSGNSEMKINEAMIKQSRLPDAIKKTMLENQTPTLDWSQYGPKKGLNEYEEKTIPAPRVKQSMNEGMVNKLANNTTGMSEERVRGMIQEELAKFFAGSYMKLTTENIQKQTIKGLIENGVIPKKANK